MIELIDVLQSIGNIPAVEIDRFMKLAGRTKIAKGSYFIREGYQTNRLGFVEKGLFRNMYVTAEGEECTFAFAAENEFIYECKAMRTFEEAQYSIQAVEDAIVIEIDYQSWVEPFQHSGWWNKILLDLTAAELSLKNCREVELMSLNGRERYAQFLEKYASIEHRIKQHMVASYLSITPVSLSRIRKEIGLPR